MERDMWSSVSTEVLYWRECCSWTFRRSPGHSPSKSIWQSSLGIKMGDLLSCAHSIMFPSKRSNISHQRVYVILSMGSIAITASCSRKGTRYYAGDLPVCVRTACRWHGSAAKPSPCVVTGVDIGGDGQRCCRRVRLWKRRLSLHHRVVLCPL